MIDDLRKKRIERLFAEQFPGEEIIGVHRVSDLVDGVGSLFESEYSTRLAANWLQNVRAGLQIDIDVSREDERLILEKLQFIIDECRNFFERSGEDTGPPDESGESPGADIIQFPFERLGKKK